MGGQRDLGPAPERVDLSAEPDHFGVNFRPILRMGFHRCTEPEVSSSSSSGGRGMEGAPPEEYDWGSAVGEHGPPLTGQLLDNTIAHVWEPHMHWLSGHPLSTKRPTDAASAGANHASGLLGAFLSVSVTHSENRSFDQDRLGADSRRPKKMMRGVFLQESLRRNFVRSFLPPPHSRRCFSTASQGCAPD